MDQKTHDKGLEIRKAVLGEAYVNNALKNSDSFNKPFQELVTEYCWGAVWGREELPHKTRSMLNLAMISILNRPHELKAHIKGALTNGVSRDEIRAVCEAATSNQSLVPSAIRCSSQIATKLAASRTSTTANQAG